MFETHSYYFSNMTKSGNKWTVTMSNFGHNINNVYKVIPIVFSVTPSSTNGYIIPWIEGTPTASSFTISCTANNISQAIIGALYIGIK